MKVIATILLAAFCAAAADQQPADPVTCTLTHDPTGVTTVKVHNGGTSALTGFNFISTLHREIGGPTYNATIGYYDALTDPQFAQPIPPGQDMILPFRIGGNGFLGKVTVAAGLFADGTSFGEPATVQKVLNRRNFMLVSLNKSINELTQASKDKLTRDQIMNQFQIALGMEMGAGLDPDLNGCIQTVRGLVIGMLRASRNPDGTPIPVETTLQSIMDTLKSRRELLKK
jgi:hypothetical protein